MKRLIYILALLVSIVGMQGQSAQAQEAGANWNWIYGRTDPRLVVTGMVLGAGASAGYVAVRHIRGTSAFHGARITPLAAYGLTTVGCAAAFPIVGTLVVQRALTTREVYTGMANCVVPFIGGWWVEAMYHGQAWYEK
jgi:hypothetical protein